MEFQVNTYTTNWQILPASRSLGNGELVVVWSSANQDGSGYGVFGRHFSSAGAPLATELQVNAHTAGAQVLPALPSDADGELVVVW